MKYLLLIILISSFAKAVSLELIANIKGDLMASPKSAIFSHDDKKIYINALEGFQTLVINTEKLDLNTTISHKFDESNEGLFKNGESSANDDVFITKTKNPNHFSGKPVEFAASHGGRYLFVSYYRRSYDKTATSPSAIAVIDTTSDEIVRVIPTCPLPKTLAVSQQNKKLAVICWGDNSVRILDISSNDPFDFGYEKVLRAGKSPKLNSLGGDRDKNCSMCLRGGAFSADGRYLFVGIMKGGGMAVFDVFEGRLLGIFKGVPPTPRHIIRDENSLFVSSSYSGYVTRLEISEILAALNGTNPQYKGQSLKVPKGARTIAKHGDYLFVACNDDSLLVVIDIKNWQIVAKQKIPPHAVGLAISKAGNVVVVTSQGKEGKGGYTSSVVKVSY